MGLFSKNKPKEPPKEEPKKIFELKGIQVGSEYIGEEKVITTLGGISGVMFISTYEGLVYQIVWLPSSDGDDLIKLPYSVQSSLIDGLNKKYGIHLSTPEIDDIDKPKYTYYADYENIKFMINVEETEDGNSFSFMIWDSELYNKKEKKDFVSDDF